MSHSLMNLRQCNQRCSGNPQAHLSIGRAASVHGGIRNSQVHRHFTHQAYEGKVIRPHAAPQCAAQDLAQRIDPLSTGSRPKKQTPKQPKGSLHTPVASSSNISNQLFGPKKAGHPAAYNGDPQFAAFKQCNDPAVAKALRVGQRQRLDPAMVAVHLPGSSLYCSLALAVAQSQAVDAKEVFEAFEFCERVRRRMRRPHMVDLACGHGLVGILMAALEPTNIQRVVLLDRRKPASHDIILRAVEAVAPWVADGRIVFLEHDLYAPDVWGRLAGALSPAEVSSTTKDVPAAVPTDCSHLVEDSRISSSNSDGSIISSISISSDMCSSSVPALSPDSDQANRNGESSQTASPSTKFQRGPFQQTSKEHSLPPVPPPIQLPSFLAVHACGTATDRCLEIASLWKSPVAVMPCCYTSTARGVPFGVRRALGTSISADVHRSYKLDAAGYVSVDWLCIPQAITDMNRILLAT